MVPRRSQRTCFERTGRSRAACHPDGLRFLQAGGPMQPGSAHALRAELHGSTGAKERRHQDVSLFNNLMREVAEGRALSKRFIDTLL